jgi:hypothetical protein
MHKIDAHHTDLKKVLAKLLDSCLMPGILENTHIVAVV